MPVVTAVALYFVIWWVSLFAVLPLGTKPKAEADPQTGWRGVPEHPRLWRKVLINTAVAAVIWLIVWGLVQSGWISFRSGWWAMTDQ